MGRDRALRQDHAVLAARLDGRWLILDSQRSELIEDSLVRDLTPCLPSITVAFFC
jgi:hypothetical protein